MTSNSPMHPADALKPEDKYRIYYYRVVQLAVGAGLLPSDSHTEIGHFAFSRHFTEGQELDRTLREAIAAFAEKYPELILARRTQQDDMSDGAVTAFVQSEPSNKMRDLILIGASYHVWPVGTSHMLTYPWDLDGNGRPVAFRSDLTDFMKRRILDILRKAGKLRNPRIIS